MPKEPKRRKHQHLEQEVIRLKQEGLSQRQIATKTGLNFRRVSELLTSEQALREAAIEIKPETLSLSAQHKLELAIRQHQRQLDNEFERAVQAGAWRYLELTIARWRKEQADAKRLIQARHGVMSRAVYKKILVCLHPDWVTDPKQKVRYEEAFSEFTKLEKLLLSERESPTTFMDFPKTRAEWEELKRKTAAERKAKRNQRTPAKA